MLADIVALVAFGGLIVLASLFVLAKMQGRKVEQMLADNDRQNSTNAAAKQSGDQDARVERVELDAASADLRRAVDEANVLLEQRLRETRDTFAQKRILDDKLKILQIQNPGLDGYPKESMTA